MSLLTAKELAAELGLKPKFVRTLALTGKIPAFRFGSEWRFDLDKVLAASGYTNPIAADARAAAQRLWARPIRRRV
ncbi:MAG TPA: helix-turn-helix domain-containing protein [Nitrospira sp.]|nr:helix-turn-helix domain-containing protein [Nitrospira sp.]